MQLYVFKATSWHYRNGSILDILRNRSYIRMPHGLHWLDNYYTWYNLEDKMEDLKSSIEAKRVVVKNLEEKVEELKEENSKLKRFSQKDMYTSGTWKQIDQGGGTTNMCIYMHRPALFTYNTCLYRDMHMHAYFLIVLAYSLHQIINVYACLSLYIYRSIPTYTRTFSFDIIDCSLWTSIYGSRARMENTRRQYISVWGTWITIDKIK